MTPSTDLSTHPTWVIHRHDIPYRTDVAGAVFELPIYHDATIVRIDWKDDSPHLWTRHQTDLIRPAIAPARFFRIVPTGMEHTGTYHGTFIDTDPHVTLVWHVVEVEGP